MSLKQWLAGRAKRPRDEASSSNEVVHAGALEVPCGEHASPGSKTKKSRVFQSSWLLDRPWLQKSNDGMWCSVCFMHKSDSVVKGFGRGLNPLLEPTKVYRFENVKDHGQRGFHLRAVMLESQKTAKQVVDVAIPLPQDVVPQALCLFRLVYKMAKQGLAFHQMDNELKSGCFLHT